MSLIYGEHPLQDALHPRLCPEARAQHCTYADGEEQGMDAGGVPVPLRRKGEGTGEEGEEKPSIM